MLDAKRGVALVKTAAGSLGGLEAVTKKLKLLRFALLCVALAELYDIYGDCAWVADLATKWSPYLVSVEQTKYKTTNDWFGAASDFTTHYTLRADGVLGLDCTLAQGARYLLNNQASGQTQCGFGYSAYNESSATAGSRVCIKARLFYDEAKLNSYLHGVLGGVSVFTYTDYIAWDGSVTGVGGDLRQTATMYDVRPNALTGFFDNASTILATLDCGDSRSVSIANGTAVPCVHSSWSGLTLAYVPLTLPMLSFVRPDALDNIRNRGQCDTLNSLYLGTLIIFAFTCVLILGKFAKHFPAVFAHLHGRHKLTEEDAEALSAEVQQKRALSLVECPFVCCLTVPFVMTKRQIELVEEMDKTEAEYTLWDRLLGTHLPDALLNARYSPGTLLGKASLDNYARCGAMDITTIILFILMVPFSPQAMELLYGWCRGIATWKWVVFFPFILCGQVCCSVAQAFSLFSILLLLVSYPMLVVVSVALYGDQKITLRIIEDIPQLIITGVFVARVEKNRSAMVSIAGNVVMLVLQTAKDLYYSIKYARTRSTKRANSDLAAMESSRSSLASLKTQLSAPRSPEEFQADKETPAASTPSVCCPSTSCKPPRCYPPPASAEDMLALSRLQQESTTYEADACECTAYPMCGDRPCTLYGRPCAANCAGDACMCCGHPCCIPGIKPWAQGFFASSYPDLTLGELLYLCFVTPLFAFFALMPPFLFVTLWRLHHRRVIAPPPEKTEQAPAWEGTEYVPAEKAGGEQAPAWEGTEYNA